MSDEDRLTPVMPIPDESRDLSAPAGPEYDASLDKMREALVGIIDDAFKGRDVPVLCETLKQLVTTSSKELFGSARVAAIIKVKNAEQGK